MNENISVEVFKFWEKYSEADEIEQRKILKTLPMFKDIDENGMLQFVSLSMIQSYFNDIIDVFKEEKK